MGSGVSKVHAAYIVGVVYRRAWVCPSAGLLGVTAVLPLCGCLCFTSFSDLTVQLRFQVPKD
jgi:hypothetical protein